MENKDSSPMLYYSEGGHPIKFQLQNKEKLKELVLKVELKNLKVQFPQNLTVPWLMSTMSVNKNWKTFMII